MELTTLSQSAVDMISSWMSANRLTVNYDKTNYMLFAPSGQASNSHSIDLVINSKKISKVSSIKFLGLLIDENLTFKFHIADLSTTLKKYVGIFYKLSFKLPQSTLKILYFSLIYSRLLYAIEIYANTYSTYLHDLSILNNRLLRIIQHKPFNTPVPSLYSAFNTLPVLKLFQFQIIIFSHELIFNPSSMPSFFKLTYQ